MLNIHGKCKYLIADKFTDNVEQPHPYFRYSEPSKEGFFFGSSYFVCKNDNLTVGLMEPRRRDTGTEMTPLGSSMPTRCHTPIKSSSPARHNTPADRSGPLVPCNTSIAISELKDCHFAKLELGAQYHSVVSNWSSREEEEKEVSKSLRHLEITDGSKSIGAARAYAWEEDERKKSCIRLIISHLHLDIQFDNRFYPQMSFSNCQIPARRSSNSSLVKSSECQS